MIIGESHGRMGKDKTSERLWADSWIYVSTRKFVVHCTMIYGLRNILDQNFKIFGLN